MNILSDIFDTDRIRIMEDKRKYMVILIVIFLIITILFIHEKDRYYTNTITNVGDQKVLIVEKDMIDSIKSSNKIIIDDLESDYSINRTEVLQDVCFVYINLEYNDIHNNTYKIYLGKERVLDYIIRILIKK